MGIANQLVTAARGIFSAPGDPLAVRPVSPAMGVNPQAAVYNLLRLYYYNNRLYRELRQVLHDQDIARDAIQGLRNPASAVVEFYAATLWPGSLPDALPLDIPDSNTRADALRDAVWQLWDWSNWGARKQVFARWQAMLGDVIVKVATRGGEDGKPVTRVFYELIEPDYAQWQTDERDFMTWIRLDVPKLDADGKQYTHTEIWDKAQMSMRIWHHTETAGSSVDKLGTPLRDEPFPLGIDFIPFVQAKFRDVGEDRGLAAISVALDKIDELNRMATRLHQLLFRHGKADKQLISSAMDPDGNPLPPPVWDEGQAQKVTAFDETMYRLPSGYRIENLIADLNYQAHLDAMKDHWDKLKNTDLPELTWYEVAEAGSDLSGKALSYKLTPARAKVDEARGNGESSLIRLDQMGLTIAQNAKLDGFSKEQIGTFDTGDFAHAFAERPIVPLHETDAAQIALWRAQANQIKRTYGYSQQQLMRDDGLTDDQIADIETEAGSAGLGGELLRRVAAFNNGQ